MVVKSQTFSTIIAILSDGIIQDMKTHFEDDKKKGFNLPLRPELMAYSFTGVLLAISKWWIDQKGKASKDTLMQELSQIIIRI